jgi:hypothetical protein
MEIPQVGLRSKTDLQKIRAFNNNLESDIFVFLLRDGPYDDEAKANPRIVLPVCW